MTPNAVIQQRRRVSRLRTTIHLAGAAALGSRERPLKTQKPGWVSSPTAYPTAREEVARQQIAETMAEQARRAQARRDQERGRRQ